ncbi:GNAT family N-acetyltransferase [Halalkalibacillus sediminis]|uniref:GNAT family N-acetyltransferase n=1 Tax=Halalkalibacillus sediminis TaxID=2018042 RepID=A0A2I0QTP0_9BACI|nr:GNAT family N-acetyltransferase [Halalkalibacillus sediminis]PKR77679.1 GNAT family N-acetyltransferase [Halalkalibacillus sediminis]
MLSKEQLQKIERLQLAVEGHDKVELKLNWYFLRTRTSEEDDFFYYDGEKLVGYLALYYMGGDYEMCGMVHPDYRRKGIFEELFHRALHALTDREFDRLFINAPADATNAKHALDKVNAKYDYSVYQMRWKKQELPEPDQSVKLRRAEWKDAEKMIDIDVQSYFLDREGAYELNHSLNQEQGQRAYLIEFDGEDIGKIRIKKEGMESYIFGFAILPEYQRKGYGKKALIEAVRMEQCEGQSIFIEVETNNEFALNLYQSVGFKTLQTQDFYLYMREV